jgi:hypothetical protein
VSVAETEGCGGVSEEELGVVSEYGWSGKHMGGRRLGVISCRLDSSTISFITRGSNVVGVMKLYAYTVQ